MKTTLIVLLFGVSVALTGCSQSQAEQPPEVTVVPAATYKAGHGVQLSPAAIKFCGVQTADVVTAPKTGVVIVPAEAVLQTAKGDFVYVANESWFLRTAVTQGRHVQEGVEILEGLYEGDTLVTEGVRLLSLAELQALNGGVGCADGH
jgi:hypothetical protein